MRFGDGNQNTVEMQMPRSMRPSAMGGESESHPDLLTATSLPEWVIETLGQNGIRRLSQVYAMTDKDLLKLRGIGRRSVELLRAEIVSHDPGNGKPPHAARKSA